MLNKSELARELHEILRFANCSNCPLIDACKLLNDAGDVGICEKISHEL